MRASGRSVIAVMSVMLLASSLVLLLPARADADWNVQVVDEKAILRGLSIALDSNDKPHIAYINTENGNYYSGLHLTQSLNPQYLMYASWTDSGWNTQTVDNILLSQVPGSIGYISLALDSHNRPHIVYSVADQNDSKRYVLKHASWTETKWSIQAIDNGTGGSIVLDSVGNPHVAYVGGDEQLKYASWNGLTWTVETVDAAGASHQSLAIDRNDRPNILYARSGSTVWAVRNLAEWSLQQVTLNESSSFGNLDLDSQGYPYFSYSWNNSIMAASWNGSGWNTQAVAPVFGLFDGSFLALDSDDNPHITYSNTTASSYFVSYATWTGETWNTQTVVEMFTMGSPMPLAFDSKGSPHICFIGPRMEGTYYSSGTVMYATSNQPVPTSIPLALWAGLLALAVVLAAIAVLAFKKRQNRKTESKNETTAST